MKTIAQIAEELNTSPSNIYAKLKNSKISLKQFEFKYQGKSKVYSEEAEAAIKKLFENKEESNETNENPMNSNDSMNSKNPSKEEYESLKRELEEAQGEIARLRENERQLMAQVSGLIDAQKALSVVAAANRLQAAPAERKGIFSRFRGLLKGNKTD